MTTIITKNSSTASAVPLAADLVQGELAVNVTDQKLYTKNSSGTIVELGSAKPAFKNRLINAQGLINQRGYVSGTATSGANQYTVDRWRVVTSGQNLTFSTTNNVVTFTAPAGGVEQVIEGLNLESGTYVLSWTGTATATVAGSAVTNGGTVTVVGGTNTTVKFSSGTFSLPQFEKGSTATSFDYRPYGTELQLCQRYYWRFTTNSEYRMGVTRSSGSSTQSPPMSYPVVMRTIPTTSIITQPPVTKLIRALDDVTGTSFTTLSAISLTTTDYLYTANAALSNASQILAFNFVSDFSAEL